MLSMHGPLLRVVVVFLLLSLTDGAPDNLQGKRNITAMDAVVEANNEQDSLTGRTEEAMDDMIFPRITSSAGSQEYSAAADVRHKIWPNGKIFYKMSANITKRPNYLRVIKAAMAEWERDTCIRFINKTGSNDVNEYVDIYYGTGCRGSVGKWGGKSSLLSLGKFCDKFRIVLHELGHTIGFFHEQNRRDRDYYVEVIWRNINPRWTRAFYLRTRPIKKPSTPYDYYSIMHYGTLTYSINGKPTLRSRNPSVKYLGNTGLSLMDIKQTNILYNCIDFPNFPEDFFFTKGEKDKTPNCVAMDEPEDPLWNTTNICYNKNKKKINIKWSKSGPVLSMNCTNMALPKNESYFRFWEDNYLCVPHDSVLRFHWSISGPIRGMKCTGIRVHAGSPYLYHLCAKRTYKTITIKKKVLESNYTSWSPWQPCSKECGGGNQSRLRQSKNERICKESLVETRVCNKNKCSSWPHWPSDFKFYIGLSKIGSITTCINIYERNQYSQWLNHKFCWMIMRRRKLKILWSDMNEVPGMRCTQITEPREKKDSGWHDNYLCVQRDAPYGFQWSSNGTIDGLYCLKWMGKQGMDGWDNNYLCADKYPEIKYSSWSPWQPCSKTCGEGTQSRLRHCIRKMGRVCNERLNETRVCLKKKCPEIKYSPWSSWQPCSKTCGEGTQSRLRHCIRKMGRVCNERLNETRVCLKKKCPEIKYSPWSSWQPCSKTCGEGTQSRLRHCIRKMGRICNERLNETRVCLRQKCPEVAYTSWSPWQSCDRICGGGNESRVRQCKHARNCGESLVQRRACNSHGCPGWPNWPEDFSFYIGVDWNKRSNHKCIRIIEREQYHDWLGHSFCWSIMRKKTLKIVWSDKWKISGMRCTQITEPREKKEKDWHNNYLCVEQDAPYRFQWSSNSTINGLRCIKWRLKNGRDGWDDNYLCADEYYEPPVSTYSPWSAWQPCSRTCGNGTQRRQRHCEEGETCLERLEEGRDCSIQPCLDWPHWPYEFYFHVGSKPRSSKCVRIFERKQYSQWNNNWFCWRGMRRGTLKLRWVELVYSREWTMDEVTGMRCTQITEPREQKYSGWDDNYLCVQRDAPYRFQWSSNGAMDGLYCIKWMGKNGKDGWDNNHLCANKSSESNGSYYTQWSPWKPCSKTCGSGSQGRFRKCYTKMCNKRLKETRACNSHSCPISSYSPWSAWQPCSKTCGNGKQSRQRHCERGGTCLGRPEETRACNTNPCLGCSPNEWITWKSKNSHFCYRMVKDKLTWPRAQTACEKYNASLLSIRNQKELTFVKDKIQKGSSVWIGANDIKTEGVWQWTDGTNFTFSKPWGSGEPNNGADDNNEDCVTMTSSGHWYDYPCEHTFYYICKKVRH